MVSAANEATNARPGSDPEPDDAPPPGPPAPDPIGEDATTGVTVPPPPAETIPQGAARRAQGGTGRRARLEISHLDTLSVFKFALVWSVAIMLVTLVATTVLYVVLAAAGVIDGIEGALVDVTSNADGESPLEGVLSFWSILLYSLGASAVLVLCLTAILTLTAVLYNASSDMVGGVRVTFRDRG